MNMAPPIPDKQTNKRIPPYHINPREFIKMINTYIMSNIHSQGTVLKLWHSGWLTQNR